MQIREDFELLESLFVELDPLEDGFVGCCSRSIATETGTSYWRPPPLRATESSGSPQKAKN